MWNLSQNVQILNKGKESFGEFRTCKLRYFLFASKLLEAFYFHELFYALKFPTTLGNWFFFYRCFITIFLYIYIYIYTSVILLLSLHGNYFMIGKCHKKFLCVLSLWSVSYNYVILIKNVSILIIILINKVQINI